MQLVRIQPAEGMFRWYSVTVTPTLFEPFEVLCQWGSLRTRYQRFRLLPCASQEEAQCLAHRIIHRKLKRGYRETGDYLHGRGMFR
jgi:predicted DNA-binding WGR domain protein